MRKLFLLLFFITGFFSSQTWGADFDKGSAAYKSGDYETALKEWTPFAEQGVSKAQYNLGQFYRLGLGVPQNYRTAVKWYTLSAKQGDAPSQSNLGVIYNKGSGVPQDFKTAAKWYTLAAEQGFAEAQTNLSIMFALGNGVRRDTVYAYMWANLGRSNGEGTAGKVIDLLVKEMTLSQIEKAQDLAQERIKKNYKGC